MYVTIMYRTSLLEYERSYVQTQIIGPYYELVEYILERNIIIIVRPIRHHTKYELGHLFRSLYA